MMRNCIVLAIEGTHASSKTTLAHALAIHYREQGIHVATVEEPARHSPFIEEIVVHGIGRFDVEAEADLLGAQLPAQLGREKILIKPSPGLTGVLGAVPYGQPVAPVYMVSGGS